MTLSIVLLVLFALVCMGIGAILGYCLWDPGA